MHIKTSAIFYSFLHIFTFSNFLFCLNQEDKVNGRFNVGPRVFTRKDKLQVQELLLHTQLDRGSFTLLQNQLAYGFAKTFGAKILVPWIFQNNLDNKKTSGLGDVRIEAQWHFYPQIENVGIATFGLLLPTGKISEEPFLGIGTYGWIFEISGIHSSDYWYASTSYRIRAHQRKNNISLGTIFFYELIVGPKIYFKNGSKIHILCEFDAISEGKTKKFEKTVENSGGNILLLGPLISYKKKDIIIEGGMQLPISQRRDNQLPKIQWLSTLTVELTF